MRLSLAVLLITCSIGAFGQTDTLTFWNGEYMVLKNDTVIYPTHFITEQSAEFAGGKYAMYQFIGKNLRVPQEVRKKKVYGRVDAIFSVDKSGMITKITVRGDTTLGRGDAARQLVKAMPRWKPAIQNGRAVPMRIAMPIGFTTEGAKTK